MSHPFSFWSSSSSSSSFPPSSFSSTFSSSSSSSSSGCVDDSKDSGMPLVRSHLSNHSTLNSRQTTLPFSRSPRKNESKGMNYSTPASFTSSINLSLSFASASPTSLSKNRNKRIRDTSSSDGTSSMVYDAPPLLLASNSFIYLIIRLHSFGRQLSCTNDSLPDTRDSDDDTKSIIPGMSSSLASLFDQSSSPILLFQSFDGASASLQSWKKSSSIEASYRIVELKLLKKLQCKRCDALGEQLKSFPSIKEIWMDGDKSGKDELGSSNPHRNDDDEEKKDSVIQCEAFSIGVSNEIKSCMQNYEGECDAVYDDDVLILTNRCSDSVSSLFEIIDVDKKPKITQSFLTDMFAKLQLKSK